MIFNSITWNPNEILADLGFIQIRYYSLMFVIAFSLGWYLMKQIFVNENKSLDKLDSLFIYVVLATLIGARLGHVIFYQPELFKEDFLQVFLPIRTRPEFEFTGFSGLASHGAAIGILIAVYLYIRKFKDIKLLWLLDRIVLPISIGGVFVRLGNFFNSEILGKVTEKSFPFAVRFIRGEENLTKNVAIRRTGAKTYNEAYNLIESDPKFSQILDTIPFRHPAQLYEAVGYIIVFIILWFLYWKTDKKNQPGYIFGVFLVLLWTVRFLVEFVKQSQGGLESAFNNVLSTGQLLSIPFIIAGFYLMFRKASSTKAS
ncbi:prolipoprotein diacylglyceryl transferase [Neptunitalea lumnitzerae]|uniref:Phosphatidylglycerol--prolipoprotein diacylglyceryl transferase n=1 Tax=Neptunitalea lumnitzerae TaxID=2965509 RepID=A0ABQ5MKI9_9FLAO|nr:prolipoprotein diacylglyceryl transferase [Neptunitalea sp. Y10]GLB49926.1 prolipoprotein diacylglyceryl transferase [Neptunitalea sp. Y10]